MGVDMKKSVLTGGAMGVAMCLAACTPAESDATAEEDTMTEEAEAPAEDAMAEESTEAMAEDAGEEAAETESGSPDPDGNPVEN